ncbi:unnamed protein product [Paramecium sonneborni]|uniref:PSI domain-containing protein n=1 Tax=Paramecium sonneborni TaxID=65129 RepID=A0A8S1RSH2_9CILI|nr:unnamed protein product [Paramecium sonneborni]
MKQNILTFVIIACGALCLSQLTVQVTNQCECSQFDQYTCGTLNKYQSCGWNATSNACESLGCRQLNNQTTCQLNFLDCWWDGSQCQSFSSCSNLNSSQNLECFQQNVQCSNQLNSTTCISLDNLPKCSQFNQTQCTLQQMGFQGTLCYWNNSTCQTAQSCTNFQENQCSQLEDTCIWNKFSNECVQIQCSDYTFEQECKFVIEGLNPQTIMPCQFVQGQCQSYQNAKSLKAQDCSQKTFQTYYWIQVSNSTGLCIPCMYKIPQQDIFNQYQPNNECQCSNYLGEQCQQADYCNWQNNTECNTLNCDQIQDQLSCIQNLQCIWQNNTCQSFTNCPKAQTQQQCLGSSFNCPFFNFTSSQCTGLSSSLCLSQTTKDLCLMQLGYCYWSGYQCYQVQTCEQITSQKQCYRFGYSCMWYQNRCQSLTCASIQDSKNCIYTIPNLYTNDVQPCIWQSGKCQNLTDSNNLNATQCISNTLHTFKWTGSSCVSCSQHKNQTKLYLEIPNQCQCSQLYNEFDCSEQSSSCMWQNNYCQQLVCSNIVIQSNCASNKNCLWSGGQCVNFTSCGSLIGTSQSECIVQSINCPGSNGKNCTNTMSPCSSYSNQSLCTHVLGNNGFCIWQNGSCQILSKCSQLTQQNDCQQFQKQCYWSNNICQPVSCSIFTNPQTCQYYYSSINSYTPIPCYWNSAQVVCAQTTTYANQLTSATCSINTKQTARWSNTLKICLTCQAPQYPNPYRCACSQLISQINCMQSLECQWNTQSNHCQQQPCTGLTQSLCIQNSQCMWNNGSCQTFTSCTALSGGSSDECASQTLRCPYYNSKTNKCQAATLNNNLTCQDINNPQECFDHQSPYFQCSWNYNTLIQLPFFQFHFLIIAKIHQPYAQSSLDIAIGQDLNVFKLKHVNKQLNKNNVIDLHIPVCGIKTNAYRQLVRPFKILKIEQNLIIFINSIYTIPNLYTNDVQPCIWNSGKCQNLTDTNSLNASQCISNTLNTFKWTGSSCVSCSQAKNQIKIYLELPNQCQCSQLYSEFDCSEQNNSCMWDNNFCQPLLCSNIMMQSSCASNKNCVWSKGQCVNFTSCGNLIGASQSDCIVQSVNCPGSNGTNCTNTMSPCSSYQDQSFCTHVLGNNGFCIWQNGACQVLSKCSQLTQQNDCLQFQNQCYWSNNICQPISCSIFTNPQTCQYYYSSINSYTPIPCYWNPIQAVCAQATNYANQLTSATCSTNTRQTARWSNTLTICLACQAPIYPNPYRCTCSQLISQINCMQSVECQWNTQSNQCQQQSCTGLTQQLCLQNSQCMWNGSCQTFTSCIALQAGSSDECAAQTLRCAFYNPTSAKCQAAILNSNQNCQVINNPYECFNYLKPYFQCYWNYNTNQCNFGIDCSNYGYQQCIFSSICYWNNGCQWQTCQNYPNKETCTFTINPTNWNYVQSCAWKNGSCVAADNLFSEKTCFLNTDQTARWSSNNEDGYCIPCSIQFNQLLVPKNKCLCAQILTQYECNLANCYWNEGFCNESGCPQSQLQCVQKAECYWLYDSNYSEGGSCEFILNPILPEFCTKLRGKNSLECLSQTTLCPISINGVCQSREHLQTCSSIQSMQICSNGIGQEGYCKYENQSCQLLTSCTQLTVQGECYLFDKACLWNVITGKCEQMTCASYSQTNCSFVYQNIDRANIEICVWNGNSCSPASYLIKQYSFQQCYQTSGGTYHWSNSGQSNGQCISCSINRIKPKNACSCTDLNEIECTLSKPVCKLIQNNQCVKSECKEIFDSIHCSEQNECMWQANSCVPFTNCTDLKGSSALDCMAQSLQCQSQIGWVCQSAQSLDSCSKYGIEFCHYGSIGSDGLCYWNTYSQVCQVISSCDKVNNQPICQSLSPACQWSYYFSSCVPFQCQDYPNELSCKNVIVNLKDPQIMLCVWKNQKCQPYEDTYYRFDSAICYVQSDHTYRWIKEDKYGVRCQQCLSAFFIMALAILIIF